MTKNEEAELGRRMLLLAQAEAGLALPKAGGSPALDRINYNAKLKKCYPLPAKASLINRMLLKQLDVADIAHCVQSSTLTVTQIMSKYNLPRAEAEG
tara:strand:- start:5 stop:295 length:291 start_codon:yes stop_codon:yes gene_type:complete